MAEQCSLCGLPLTSADMFTPLTGVCTACQSSLTPAAVTELKTVISVMEEPVVITDQDSNIITGNPSLADLLGKSVQEIEGIPCGNMFDCTHSFQPEGCGNTEQCPACEIRENILATYSTGKQVEIHTTLTRRSESGELTVFDPSNYQ